MTDKKLITDRFFKNFSTYDDNAFVQNIMASNLTKFVPVNNFNSVFEVGCGTGVLTKYIKSFFLYKSYTANDIVKESKKYVQKIIKDVNFVCGDIEQVKIDKKFDLIISNACLQWCNNLNATIIKLVNMLNKNGILAISIFGQQNLCEIKKLLNVSLNYPKIADIINNVDNCKTVYIGEEIKRIYFDSPIDIIKHFKQTGVNAVSSVKFTKTTLKEFEIKYKKLFVEDEKCYITYNPIYVVLQKNFI
jgi:malonyl-CoA O-methyltransferase